MDRVKYLIIGNSAGGIGATEAIRELDKTGTMAIVSDEPYPTYSRPLISEHLALHCTLGKILYRPSDFYQKINITPLLGEKVTHLDGAAHTVEFQDGHVMTWEKLLLAAGGLPIIPPVKGIEGKGVFTFTTLDDAKNIDEFLLRFPNWVAPKVAVIGGGLIGVSVTEALVKRGVDVSIIEMKDRLLNIILDEEASTLAEQAVNRAGVKILKNCTVSKINRDSSGMICEVILDNGNILPCQVVVMAIGVRPRLELAAGIKTNRGIIIDCHMMTSCPDIYACGDVAEAYDFIYGENRLSPILPNAYIGGRVAGFNMAGKPVEYHGGTSMNSIKYFGLSIASAGMVIPPDESYTVIKSNTLGNYRKLIIKDNQLVGMVLSGNIERAGIFLSLMREKINVSGFKNKLAAADFGLASLPDDMWKSCLQVVA